MKHKLARGVDLNVVVKFMLVRLGTCKQLRCVSDESEAAWRASNMGRNVIGPR